MKNFNLNVKKSSNVLCFVVEGRIDSSNATDFSNAISSKLANDSKSDVVFDCQKLSYISSAGLRVLLSLKKKLKSNIKLINVSPEVYGIFEVTGFLQIFGIKKMGTKGIKDISELEVQLIGGTGNMSVYRIDNDTILKLYPKGTDFLTVERELNFIKTAFLSGIPTLISYSAVTYKGDYGILYEMPNVVTVSSEISKLKLLNNKLLNRAYEMGKTLKLIHSCEPEDDTLPETSKIFGEYVLKMKPYLHNDEIEKLKRALNVIPKAKTVVYGNYHSGNVFVENDELILINMSEISRGNPIFDLGRTYMIYVSEAEWLSKILTNLEPNEAKKFWDYMIRGYFDADINKLIQYDEDIIKAAAMLFSVLLPAINKISSEHTERLIANARRDFFPNIDTIINLLAQARF